MKQPKPMYGPAKKVSAMSEKKKIDSAMQMAKSKSNIKSKMAGSSISKMKMKK
jgi:hypothetical protein